MSRTVSGSHWALYTYVALGLSLYTHGGWAEGGNLVRAGISGVVVPVPGMHAIIHIFAVYITLIFVVQ